MNYWIWDGKYMRARCPSCHEWTISLTICTDCWWLTQQKIEARRP